MMSSIPVIYLLPNYNFQAISTKLIHFDVSINLLRSIYFPDSSLSRLINFITRVQYVCKIFCIHYMYVFTKRDMPIVMCIYLIQIHTFLLFNVLKREVSNVFLYIWTINYFYSYSHSYSCSFSYSYSSYFLFLFLKRNCLNIDLCQLVSCNV